MAKNKKLIQLGGQRLDLNQTLNDKFKFQYFSLADPKDVFAMQQELLDEKHQEHLDPKYSNTLFILGNQSMVYIMPKLIKDLPANNIIYQQGENFSDEIGEALSYKNAQSANLADVDEVTQLIEQVYFGGQFGDRLDKDRIDVNSELLPNMTQTGSGQISFHNLTLPDQVQAINFQMTLAQGKDHTLMEFWPEYKLQGAGKVQFKLYFLDAETDQIVKQLTVSESDLDQPVAYETTQKSTNLYVSVFLQGTIESFTLRRLHIRNRRRNLGTYMVGSKTLTDQQNYRGQIATYFNPGDLKPPLNVYFSGYRTAEGFEGGRMMSNISSAPYLLIADERMEGGSFYVGSKEFERQLIATIKDCLKKLNFSNKELVLSGISMGTTAALYYATDLSPAAVIVGKPLVNLGTIARNSRLHRPADFLTSLDLLLMHEGSTDQKAQDHFNQYFWNHFKNGHFAKTIFAIAYMKQDDYDKGAYNELFNYFKQQKQAVKVISKGLIGRHNDDTDGIVNWFVRQYHNLMQEKFDRS